MIYEVRYSAKAQKQLKKLDKSVVRVLIAWIEKNLVNTSDPRIHGKGLTANKSGFWRYRIGNYRIIADIKDNELIIEVVEVAHRSVIS